MPHKHKKDRSRSDITQFDLPPSKTAQPLPVGKHIPTKPTQRTKKKHTDDTPRAFARLFSNFRTPRSGLDDGERPSKKRRLGEAKKDPQSFSKETAVEVPKIQRNESLSAFSARVNTALPLKGVKKQSGAAGNGVGKARQTKLERRMQKMQNQWREEDRRLREEAELEASESDSINDDDTAQSVQPLGKGRKKRNGKSKAKASQVSEVEEDPWAHIGAKTSTQDMHASPGKGLVGLHDVVQAPPRLSMMRQASSSSAKMKIRSGGLRRQGELQEAREQVIGVYREQAEAQRKEQS